MSELAFNANGDSFEVPASVTGWRVRRMKPRGAPELVYSKDGHPLTIGIEADIEELREAVGAAGKYRLDPINEDGKCVEGVPAAYVQVVRPERAPHTGGAVAAGPSDDAIREAMRLNTELAKAVIDRFPEVMHASAELLRAADGAGLPARAPRVIDVVDQDEDDDEADREAPHAGSAGLELLNTLVAQIVPVVVTSLMGKKLPNLGAIFDWRKAAAEGTAKREAATRAASMAHREPASAEAPAPAEPVSAAASEPAELPPLDPAAMAHFIAIQGALAPAEAQLAREVASELSPSELRAWFGELSALSVPDAVAKIRAFVGGQAKPGAAS